jgi:hypothetical protein
LLNENITDDVIKKVEVGDSWSPREYNFTTDKAEITFEVDAKKLAQYVKLHEAKYHEEKMKSCDGFLWLGNEDERILNWYLQAESTKLYKFDDYVMEQLEQVEQWEFIEQIEIK